MLQTIQVMVTGGLTSDPAETGRWSASIRELNNRTQILRETPHGLSTCAAHVTSPLACGRTSQEDNDSESTESRPLQEFVDVPPSIDAPHSPGLGRHLRIQMRRLPPRSQDGGPAADGSDAACSTRDPNTRGCPTGSDTRPHACLHSHSCCCSHLIACEKTDVFVWRKHVGWHGCSVGLLSTV